ncbi:MAG: hypothetical protein PHG61_03305 [Candidatus Marinimicrobia bacterium]|nr:hypothetical protein [Candidatus Neomarinimicrobiota bacterium]
MLIKGITKLSELLIDADKDWNAKGITNIKQVAALMSKGDILQRGDTILQRLAAGPDGYVLTAAGPGKLCTWAPAGGALKYYFPAILESSIATAVIAGADQNINKNAPLISSHLEVTGDDVAHYLNRILATIGLTDAQTVIAAADQSILVNGPLITEGGLQMLIDGAVADDGGVETDETAAARDATANDMTLLPAAPAVGDAYMLGSVYPVARFPINVGTAGAGNWTLQLKYWNGAWVNCVGEIDTTNEFTASGLKYIQHTPQGDWASHVVQGMDLYWVRFEVVNFVNIVTQPFGTQAWWEHLV